MQGARRDERGVRAARNEALFRALNAKLSELRDRFQPAEETFVVACECADTSCVEMFDITPEEYAAVRASGRRFAVLPGHAYAGVERVVSEHGRFTVVEKTGQGGELAEATAANGIG